MNVSEQSWSPQIEMDRAGLDTGPCNDVFSLERDLVCN